ncbi:MAG: proton-conducting membrane transporter [Lachnospiraceae bacterium]|nr:proton-conducting membrane transporter [Lachnospiraceae bacterium]
MSAFWILLTLFLPIIGGAALGIIKPHSRRVMEITVMTVTLLTSACVALILAVRPDGEAMILQLAESLSVKFFLDGSSCVFAGLVALLWPIASLYAIEYMETEDNRNTFFAYYTLTYGITLGIAFSANLMTMYMFYEMLTLVTIPLMMHGLKFKAVVATRKYVRYSLGGAAFAFIGFIAIVVFGETIDFRLGGVLADIAGKRTMLRIVYVMAVLGFGVKAAVFPFHGWLPSASVAPTPVTALLHAVAVVKAGAFAIIRITYYSFGTTFLRASWAQYTVMGFAVFTMVYGSVKAVKEQHCKRRLAYSTVSNLSYILFAVTLMTEVGMTAAYAHILAHGLMKITLFYCIGAVNVKAHRHYVWEMDGMGRRMKTVFIVYTIAGLSLIGIPPMIGFVSKWYIGNAAVAQGTVYSYIGLAALILSALLTAAYILEVVVRAWLPGEQVTAKVAVKLQDNSGEQVAETVSTENTEIQSAQATENASDVQSEGDEIRPVGWRMRLPLVLLATIVVAMGIWSGPVLRFLADVAAGLR